MIIAIDFDDTLFRYNHLENKNDDYSGRLDSIGDPIWKTIDKAKKRKESGDKLILWTCREGRALQHAIKACKSVGLTFDAINCNVRLYPNWPDCRKVHADEYWDDKAVCVSDDSLA